LRVATDCETTIGQRHPIEPRFQALAAEAARSGGFSSLNRGTGPLRAAGLLQLFVGPWLVRSAQ